MIIKPTSTEIDTAPFTSTLFTSLVTTFLTHRANSTPGHSCMLRGNMWYLSLLTINILSTRQSSTSRWFPTQLQSLIGVLGAPNIPNSLLRWRMVALNTYVSSREWREGCKTYPSIKMTSAIASYSKPDNDELFASRASYFFRYLRRE